MGYQLWIGLKYLRAKRRHATISVVTFLSVLGVGVGVTALIVVISVINGFEENLKERILGLTAHALVFQRGQEMKDWGEARRQLLEVPGVAGASPFIVREVILQGATKSVQAVIRAVDPQTVETVIPLAKILQAGRLSDLNPPDGGDYPGIILGKELLRELGAAVGDTVVLVSPEGTLTPWGNLPKWKRFQVKGFFDAGYWDFDSKVGHISIAVAQDLFEIHDRVTGIELRMPDIYAAPRVRLKIHQSPLGANFIVQDWTQLNRNIMIALSMQKRVIFIILLCIVGVAALLIISILVMMVMEKQKEIAVLKAMGARSMHILCIFVCQGLLIGSAGTVLGCLGGLLISWNLEWIVGALERALDVRFLPEDVYYVGQLTSRVSPADLGIIVVVTLLISVTASLYPSWRASRLDPVEGLRYE